MQTRVTTREKEREETIEEREDQVGDPSSRIEVALSGVRIRTSMCYVYQDLLVPESDPRNVSFRGRRRALRGGGVYLIVERNEQRRTRDECGAGARAGTRTWTWWR